MNDGSPSMKGSTRTQRVTRGSARRATADAVDRDAPEPRAEDEAWEDPRDIADRLVSRYARIGAITWPEALDLQSRFDRGELSEVELLRALRAA